MSQYTVPSRGPGRAAVIIEIYIKILGNDVRNDLGKAAADCWKESHLPRRVLRDECSPKDILKIRVSEPIDQQLPAEYSQMVRRTVVLDRVGIPRNQCEAEGDLTIEELKLTSEVGC
jgi:hypothetical protein